MGETCTIEGCERPLHRRQWCNGCYQRGLKAGTVTRLRGRSTTERFWEKVDRGDGCWLWLAHMDASGYGKFYIGTGRRDARMIYAHRFSYELANGPIPAGFVLDHLCRTPTCVRPDHLEAVTQRENMLRGMAPAAIVVRLNRCCRGHELTPENTLVMSTNGRRQCRTCNHLRYLQRKESAA